MAERSFGAWLRVHRDAIGISQQDLARRCGPPIEPYHIARWETGTWKTPGKQFRVALARGLAVSEAELWRAIGETPPDAAGEGAPETPPAPLIDATFGYARQVLPPGVADELDAEFNRVIRAQVERLRRRDEGKDSG